MRRRLGQHFLKNRSALKKIASALDISSDDIVIEIGPGHGELTQYLLDASPKKLIVIEKDDMLANSFELKQRVDMINGDALKVLPSVISHLNGNHYKLVGNIPYYITGRLMRVVGELDPKPKCIVFTIQKEVAERICSTPPRMNLLAASIQFWGKPSIVGYIGKSSFQPQPEIDSAILSIKTNPAVNKHIDEQYYKLIRILFKQPRKTVLNNLRSCSGIDKTQAENVLRSVGVDQALRPGDLAIPTLIKLNRVFWRQT